MIAFKAYQTKSIAATSTSGAAAFTAGDGDSSPNVRVYNAGPNVAFVRWGTGTPTAVATDIPVAPGAIEVFYKGYANGVAAICAATETAKVYFTAGEGV